MEKQAESLRNYQKHGIKISKVEEDTVVIKQETLLNGYILNQKQLVTIAKSIYPDYKIKPVVYSINVDKVTIEWINDKLNEFGIKNNDLVKQLTIDKATLTLYLSSNKELTKPIKALFFYYFLTYEINKAIRSDFNFIENAK